METRRKSAKTKGCLTCGLFLLNIPSGHLWVVVIKLVPAHRVLQGGGTEGGQSHSIFAVLRKLFFMQQNQPFLP